MLTTPIQQQQQQQQQDPEVLQARVKALTAQLTALDAARDADKAVAEFNYLQKKSTLTKQQQITQQQLDSINTTSSNV